MAEITLWGRLSSCNVQKAMWLLEELALPYAHINSCGDFGGLDDPAYLAMNPHGRVPPLNAGDIGGWESGAYLISLASRYAAPGLWSAVSTARAAANQFS